MQIYTICTNKYFKVNKHEKLIVVLTSVFLLNYGVKIQNTVKDWTPVFQYFFNTSMTENEEYYRIPAVTTAPNGDVIAAIDERVPGCGDLKWRRDINIIMGGSADHILLYGACSTRRFWQEMIWVKGLRTPYPY